MHKLATRRSYANGDVITRQGAMPKCLFLLISGECRALRKHDLLAKLTWAPI
jgi:CRP-like cAMP-binding protein